MVTWYYWFPTCWLILGLILSRYPARCLRTASLGSGTQASSGLTVKQTSSLLGKKQNMWTESCDQIQEILTWCTSSWHPQQGTKWRRNEKMNRCCGIRSRIWDWFKVISLTLPTHLLLPASFVFLENIPSSSLIALFVHWITVGD